MSDETLQELTWWVFDKTCIGMGAERQFDYADAGTLQFKERLGRCYELAGSAFAGWEMFLASLPDRRPALVADGTSRYAPAPVGLVHGSWQGPEPKRIKHAWVLLADGRVWEPITSLICDPVLFYEYTKGAHDIVYTQRQAAHMMLRSGHYGPWT